MKSRVPGLEIRPAAIDDLEILKSWLGDRESTFLWGGPHFRYPFTDESFLEDVFWGQMPTYSALDENGVLAAFGQYYGKAGRCHLARLVVDPGRRAAGIGSRFIAALIAIGKHDLGARDSSLFVLEDNAAALGCYRKLGFREHEWPEGQEKLEGIVFMVRSEG